MAQITPSKASRRRRRSPAEAEREIILAAEALLRERPFRELTVDEVMRRTDLSRPSFYVYFRDRHHLVLRVVEHLSNELFAMSERWLHGTGTGPERARASLEGTVDVFIQHGPVIRALVDAASDDPDVEREYCAIIDRFVALTAEHIAREIAEGAIIALDPLQTAKALVWMNERYLLHTLTREPRTAREVVIESLATIWSRTLYGAR